MKTTELQINDWVMYEGKPRRITGLDETCVYFRVGCCTECRNAESVIPVPLISAILERNGFAPIGPGTSMGWLSDDERQEVLWHKERKDVDVTFNVDQETEK